MIASLRYFYMEKAAEHIATPDLSRVNLRRTPLTRLGNGQGEAAVRSLLVVVRRSWCREFALLRNSSRPADTVRSKRCGGAANPTRVEPGLNGLDGVSVLVDNYCY
jgi:hypothetical protein